MASISAITKKHHVIKKEGLGRGLHRSGGRGEKSGKQKGVKITLWE
jgi:hypothetical protein